MDRRTFVKSLPALTLLAGAASSYAEDPPKATPEKQTAEKQNPGQDLPKQDLPQVDLPPIVLEKPQMEGGKSVLAALKERKTTRNISAEKLSPQMLSNLLWAAFGVNREQGPSGQAGRTAASASNSQEIDLYVALPEGVYLYEAAPHRLVPVLAGDQRGKVNRRSRQGGVSAPVILIFVADLAKYGKARRQEPGLKDPEIQKSYYYVDTGLIAGNVYLFAASQGLAAWFHNCNKPALTEELKLRPDQRVLFAQTVGHPA
jgi:hypothetical protein